MHTTQTTYATLAREATLTKGNDPNTAERIVRAALHLFRERGYKRTTMADIALQANVVKATLYLHTDGKSELFYKALVTEKLDAFNHLAPLLDTSRPHAERLRLYIQQLFTFPTRCPLLHRLQNGDEDLRKALQNIDPNTLQSGLQRSSDFHDELLQPLIPDPHTRDHIRRVLNVFATTITTPSLPPSLFNLTLEDTADTISELLTEGILAHTHNTKDTP